MPTQDIAQNLLFPTRFRSCIDQDAYHGFLNKLCRQEKIKYAVLTLPAEDHDVLPYLKQWESENEFLYYWEKPSQNIALAASGTLIEINANGSSRFDDTYAAIQNADAKTLHFNADTPSQTSIHFLGGFSFLDDENVTEDWQPFGSASFVLPKRMAAKREGKTTISIALKIDSNDTPQEIQKSFLEQLQKMKVDTIINETEKSALAQNQLPKNDSINQNNYKQWIQSVEEAKQNIAQEKLEKVVLTRQIKLPKDKSQTPAKVIDRLRNQYPTCCSFLIRKKNASTFVGCSPERLLSFKNKELQTEALAGSFPRGADKNEDSTFKSELLNSEKNQREHQFVVESIEQNLAPLVEDMQHSKKPVVKKLPNVQHLYTPIKANIKEGSNPLSLLGNLHPTPAVGGTPKKKALAFIKQHESFDRGWFASPVGWINSDDEGEFTVAIRSGLISKTSALLFAGCGIVGDSNPQTEWEETNLKFMPMLSALNYD